MAAVRKVILVSFFLIVIGGGGLAYLFWMTLPTLGPRWLFFFFLLITVSGLALPISAFLNYRFQKGAVIQGNVIIREAVFCGICVDLLAWLQMGRELTGPMALIIIVGFILIEILLRVSERSRWKPN
jgi:hypothetical protein